jgi:hypothetical protein
MTRFYFSKLNKKLVHPAHVRYYNSQLRTSQQPTDNPSQHNMSPSMADVVATVEAIAEFSSTLDHRRKSIYDVNPLQLWRDSNFQVSGP